MTSLPTRPFGRTGQPVAAVWRERADGIVVAGTWTGLIVETTDLVRRGGDRVRRRAALLGRPFDFFLARDLHASDLKVGWPMHWLLKFREEKLGRFFVIDAADALEAEWIVENAPVQGVCVGYAPADMAARYRVFDAAKSAGVSLVGRADTAADAALHLATPPLVATLLATGVAEPSPLTAAEAEAHWAVYAATHTPPVKPRSGHPPEYGA